MFISYSWLCVHIVSYLSFINKNPEVIGLSLLDLDIPDEAGYDPKLSGSQAVSATSFNVGFTTTYTQVAGSTSNTSEQIQVELQDIIDTATGLPKNNGNTNEIIIGVWEAGYVSRPELPKDIWTISKDKIIAESFEPYSHQFDNKSLIDSAIYILKDNTISITYPNGTVPYVINIIDSDTILLGDKKYGMLLNRKQAN